MTKNNFHNKNNSLNNALKSETKIKINMYKGVLTSNLFDFPEPPVPPTCIQNSLDFSCPENSEYIPVI